MPSQLNIIPRTNVIEGAEDDDYSVGGGGGVGPAAIVVQNVEHVLDSTAMQAISTPVEVIAAPSGSLGIVIISIRLRKAADAYGGNNVLRLRYEDGSGDVIATIPATVFSASGAQDVWASPHQPDQGFPEVAAAVVAHANGDYTGTGGDVTINVKYIVIEDA